MSATVLDGKALAARVRGELTVETARLARGRRHARSGRRAGRRRSRLADLRAQQDGRVRAGRHQDVRSPAAGDDAPTPSCWRWSRRSTPIPRVDGILIQLPLPAGHRRAPRVVRRRSAQGRRRHPPRKRRPPADGRAALRRLHAVRRDEADRRGAAAAGRRQRRRRRPFEHGRQADGGVAARRGRDRDGLPLEDARSRGRRRARRSGGRRRRAAPR